MSETETVRWSLDPRESRLALACLYGAYGFPLGMVMVVALGLLALAATALLADQLAVVAVVVLFALVGGPMSLLYLLPMLKDAEQRPRLFALSEHLRPIPLAVASLVGAGVLVLSVVGGGWTLLLYAIAMAAMFTTANAFNSAGELDPDRRILRIQTHSVRSDRELALDEFGEFRRFAVGGIVAFRLVPVVRRLDSTEWVVVPNSVAPVVQRAIESGIAHESPAEPKKTNRAVQATLVALGLLFVGAAAGIVLVGRSTIDSPRAIFMLASLVGMFGFIFLAVGYRS